MYDLVLHTECLVLHIKCIIGPPAVSRAQRDCACLPIHCFLFGHVYVMLMVYLHLRHIPREET
jgi:hypothetical protein